MQIYESWNIFFIWLFIFSIYLIHVVTDSHAKSMYKICSWFTSQNIYLPCILLYFPNSISNWITLHNTIVNEGMSSNVRWLLLLTLFVIEKSSFSSFCMLEKHTTADLNHDRRYKNGKNRNKTITDYNCFLAVTIPL